MIGRSACPWLIRAGLGGRAGRSPRPRGRDGCLPALAAIPQLTALQAGQTAIRARRLNSATSDDLRRLASPRTDEKGLFVPPAPAERDVVGGRRRSSPSGEPLVARDLVRREADGAANPHIIAMLGLEELSAADQLTVRRARRLEHFLTQPFFVTEMFTGHEGRRVPLAQTVAGCEAILEGRYDDRDEGSLYMIGPIEEAKP